MSSQPTVLVIGGGATGTGIARDLTLRGVDVTLIDRGGLGSGASGRSHGLLHSGARYAESDPQGAAECVEANATLRHIAGACIRDTGGLFVSLDADDPAYLDRKRAACEEVGIDVEQLTPAAARELAPDLADTVARVLRVPDAVIYPSRLVAANAADAARHGATIHPHAPLEELTVTDGRVQAAMVGGSVDATLQPEYVVNATGAWAESVAAMAGLEVPMRPTRGVMVAVDYDAPHPVLNRCRPPDDGDIVVPHPTETVVGTTSVAVADPDDYDRATWESDRAIAECARMLPPVADAAVHRSWWGVRPLYEPDETERGGRGISRGFFRLDHAADGVTNMVSIVGGKLTTYREMAAAVTDLVCDRLSVTAACETATRRLPGADDPAQLDAFAARYDAGNPTDADIVQTD